MDFKNTPMKVDAYKKELEKSRLKSLPKWMLTGMANSLVNGSDTALRGFNQIADAQEQAKGKGS